MKRKCQKAVRDLYWLDWARRATKFQVKVYLSNLPLKGIIHCVIDHQQLNVEDLS